MLFWLCLAVVVTQGVFGLLSIRHYGALPRIPTIPRRGGLPRVSIIIPARNEAAHLGRLLASLLNLDYASYEVIVVDDGSADVFAHFSAINSTGFRSLNEGDKVSYEVQQGPKGLQAANITVVR